MNNEILCFELDDNGRDYVHAELTRVIRKGTYTPDYFDDVVTALELATKSDCPSVELPSSDTVDGQPYTLTVPGSMYDTHYVEENDLYDDRYLLAAGVKDYRVDLPEDAPRIISYFEINKAGEEHIAHTFLQNVKVSKQTPYYVDSIISEMTYYVDQGFPYYEISQFDTISGRPVVITLKESEYKTVYLEDEE